MSAIRKLSESAYIFLDIQDHTLDGIDKVSQGRDGTPELDLNARPPCYGLGTLETLPLEVVHLTLIQLDMQSLIDFRRVNRRARQVADSVPQFRHILAQVPASIRASLGLETARYFSCQELYQTLCTAECESCGDFGGYLYLLTCRRVCFLCFTEKPDYLPLSRKVIIRKFGLGSAHIALLPRMRSLPGCYSPRELKCRRRETLFDHFAARQAGITLHGSPDETERHTSATVLERREAYSSRVSLRRSATRRLRPPRSEDSFDGYSSNPKRFMGIIRAPFLYGQEFSPEWGFHCLACKLHHYCRPFHWRRLYTSESFQGHISECGPIIDGKHVGR
ncbi:hypothetical protein BDQ94DRAFT_178881 [Aspergillus welwitschiae]|uniref:F-box domain-containing protein n=1 Tax=Aspergillus welwitschiae TaxID=1341132 RepID=A0A3F3Q2K1_9EURO|nr:hypothetical protein BDQ94DRAFT_178881 [Aspergillus welwitschiae]RDH33410.1 hypothetical protein BDQ94DRAFT_178881 [Aspergillus welwitschiae]